MLNHGDVTVVTPCNDGESRAIVDICRRLQVDCRVSKQPWGATLDLEPESNLTNLRPIVIVVEMPSPEKKRHWSRPGIG